MRLLLAAVVVALAAGVFALTAAGDESTWPQRSERPAVVEQAELPPLPEMRPKVVEPEAGAVSRSAPAEPDPGLADAA